MFAHLIHQLFDGTLLASEKEHLLETVSKNDEAKAEYRIQERIHEAVRLDNNAILAASNADDDLAAIFARVEPAKKKVLPLPILPAIDANAPELPHEKGWQAPPRYAGFAPMPAPHKTAEHESRRRFVPIFSKMSLQALCFCVVGAVAATFGAMPIGYGSARLLKSETVLHSNGEPHLPASESSHAFSGGHSDKALPTQSDGVQFSLHGVNHVSSLASGVVLADSTHEATVSVVPNDRGYFAQTINNQSSELLQTCVFKGKKRFVAYPDDWLPDGATPLAVTTLPRAKAAIPAKPVFKPFLALTSRLSTNVFPSGGYGASIGALYAISERDAFGVEVGGTFGRQGFKSGNTESVQNLNPTAFLANVYRFTLPVEGTNLSVFSHIRAGIETTGTLFGGIGFGAQYQITDKFFVFGTVEAARTLWKAPTSDQSFKLAHDGISLGVAVKL